MSSKTEKYCASSRWENEGGATISPTHAPEITQQLAGYRIGTKQLTAHEWSDNRYTNMKDAIAAAKGLVR